MNYKSLLILGFGVLVNSLWVTSAKALTFSFSREYAANETMKNKALLEGVFKATDNNNDGFILADEVEFNTFQATFNYGNQSSLSLEASEPKVVNQFSYAIGTNNLFFNVRTDRPTENPVIDPNIEFNVNFARNFDGFRNGDFILLTDDFQQTGVVAEIPDIVELTPDDTDNMTNVPEGDSSLALLILGGLGISSMGKKLNRKS
ncbi:hypothetical protein VB715_19040 [Crocosphaera sp. UHCC 0190]|uniref:hypothetical protein n=1 Tax=Crocosphaera sp. UHCC 0190 TaxID=3110246 RepID=UPI002B209A26|nr:hypothetical protein [Crocosphaera sp. UHCC 0190]MEA5511872.1 hypothetical protein [Crocosphaera sp. UHCC 0190]